MQASGFVLAGGRSVRMGRDKASLPYHGVSLLEHIARILDEALSGQGAVAIVGDPAMHRTNGYPVHTDRVAGCGPMGGISTALTLSATSWNLVVACDMPNLEASALRDLLDRATTSRANCVLASGKRGEPEPLCGVYHRRCLPLLDRAIRDKRLKMKDLIPELGAEMVAVPTGMLANVNTPAEWNALPGQPE